MEWAIDVLLFWAYVVFLFFVGSWASISYPVRYLPPVLLLVGSIWGGRRFASLPARPETWGRPAAFAILAAVLGFFALQVVVAQTPGADPAVHLAFPLRNGTYYVLEGGRHGWINRHAVVDSSRTTVEFARLGSWNRLDSEARPAVFSPSAGRVVGITGGTVALLGPLGIGADSVLIELGPITDLVVAVGDSLAQGSPIGRIDVAGRELPSLVVRVSRNSHPAPVRFDGYYLTRNALFIAPSLAKPGGDEDGGGGDRGDSATPG